MPVPPLRERADDIPLLVEHCSRSCAPSRTPPRLTRAALRALGQHRWPGNVRELENALERGVAMGGDVIDRRRSARRPSPRAAARPEPREARGSARICGSSPRCSRPSTRTSRRRWRRAKNNQTVAARLLGLSRFGLQKKLRRLSGEDTDDD